MQQSTACVLLYAFISFFTYSNQLFAGNTTNTQLVLSGSITYPSQNQIEVAIFSDPLMYREEHYLMILDASNHFYTTVTIDAACMAELRYQDRTIPLWLEPGQDLSIDLDGSNFPTSLKFNGSQGATNNFLASFYNQFGGINSQVEAFMATADAASYVEFITRLSKDRQRFIGKDEAFKAAPDGLKKDIALSEKYWFASQLLRYASDKPLFSGETTPLKLNETYYSFLSQVEINPENALENNEYRCFIDRYVEYLRYSGKNPNESVYAISESKMSGASACYIQGREIALLCRNGQASAIELEEKVNCFITRCGNSALCAAVQSIYDESLSTQEGSMAPDFSLLNAKGEQVSLSDFRGKVVYLEFWATWCGPCRKEVPKLQAMATDLGKDVVVLYVSMDKDESTWRNYVYGSSMPTDDHLYGDDMNTSEVAQRFGVRVLPAAFLIDQCGQVAYIKKQEDSCEEIRPMIQSLLDFKRSTIAE